MGIRIKLGLSSGSMTSIWIRSGPGWSASMPSSGGGPSSAMGLLVDTARLSLVGITSVGDTVMTLPLTSRILIVTGQMISILSPRVPAKTASFVALMTVGNGQLITARVELDGSSEPAGSTKMANCFVRPESQMLARREVSG